MMCLKKKKKKRYDVIKNTHVEVKSLFLFSLKSEREAKIMNYYDNYQTDPYNCR